MGTPAGHGTVFYHILPFMEGENIYNNTADWSWNSSRTTVKNFMAPLDFTLPASGLHWHNRGAISYAANTYTLQDYESCIWFNGIGEMGPNSNNHGHCDRAYTSLPKITAQDGTSNTIGFGERFAVCSVQTPTPDGNFTTRNFERIWGEDGQGYNWYAPFIYQPVVSNTKDASCKQPKCVPFMLMPEFGGLKKACNPATWNAFGTGALQVSLMDGSVRSVTPGISRETWTNALLPDDGLSLGTDW